MELTLLLIGLGGAVTIMFPAIGESPDVNNAGPRLSYYLGRNNTNKRHFETGKVHKTKRRTNISGMDKTQSLTDSACWAWTTQNRHCTWTRMITRILLQAKKRIHHQSIIVMFKATEISKESFPLLEELTDKVRRSWSQWLLPSTLRRSRL